MICTYYFACHHFHCDCYCYYHFKWLNVNFISQNNSSLFIFKIKICLLKHKLTLGEWEVNLTTSTAFYIIFAEWKMSIIKNTILINHYINSINKEYGYCCYQSMSIVMFTLNDNKGRVCSIIILCYCSESKITTYNECSNRS